VIFEGRFQPDLPGDVYTALAVRKNKVKIIEKDALRGLQYKQHCRGNAFALVHRMNRRNPIVKRVGSASKIMASSRGILIS
jgi:hypothetical protein